MARLYFPLATHVVSLILLIIFFRKPKISSSETRLFGYMLVLSYVESIIACTIQVLTYKFYINPELMDFFLIILNKLYYVSLIYWITLLFIYITNINYKKKRYLKFRNSTLTFTGIVTMLLSFGGLRIVDHNGMLDVAGLSVIILYVVLVLYIVMAFAIVLVNRNKINVKTLPFFMFFLMMVFTFILRFVYPDLDLASSVIVYVNLIMFHTIENPDVKLLKQMEEAKILAEKANYYKTSFISNMSHEIRTPLNAIVGLSQINLDEEDSDEIKRNSEDILNASNILLDIVGNILDISKIETGNIEIINNPYNFYELIENIESVVKPKFTEKDIKLNTEIAPDIPELFGDKTNMKKIIINLLSNAVKYTDEGHVDFRIDSYVQDNVCKLIISVEDTGRGIKSDELDVLFEKFSRLERDKNSTIEGTGLGLAITKAIIDEMGGHITVQSVYQKGSKFTVKLNQKVNNQAMPQTNINVKEEKRVYFPNKKILLVDDNNLNLSVGEKFLSTYGVETVTATSAKEGLKIIDETKDFDLIVLDEMMPEMTGSEMMQILKEQEYDKPIIVLTADAESESEDKYLSRGFDDYLKKPIEKRELENILKKFL